MSVAGFRRNGKGVDKSEIQTLPRVISQLLLPLIFFVWLAYLSFASHNFLTWLNFFNVTRQIAVIGVLSMAQLLCLLTGNIDLSIGSFLGLFGALLAGLSLRIGFIPALAICVLVAIVWGLMNGFLVTRSEGISVIVTLSTLYIAEGLTLIYTSGRPIMNFPFPLDFLGAGNLGQVPYSLITFTIVCVVVWFVLRLTPLGRHLYATGGNKQAAIVSGIDTKKLIMGVYLSSALLAGLASILLLGRVAAAEPTAGTGMELDSIATVLIGGASVSGGRGGVITTVLGIFMLGFINNGLNLLGISGFWQYVFKGAIILVAVMVDNLRQQTRG